MAIRERGWPPGDPQGSRTKCRQPLPGKGRPQRGEEVLLIRLWLQRRLQGAETHGERNN